MSNEYLLVRTTGAPQRWVFGMFGCMWLTDNRENAYRFDSVRIARAFIEQFRAADPDLDFEIVNSTGEVR